MRALSASSSWYVGSDESFERQHYALAAALLRTFHELSPGEVLSYAQTRFWCCTLTVPADECVERVNLSDCPALLERLRSTRTRADFGEVDAFVSHTQYDDERLKWLALRRWATAFHKEHGRWPRIWFDRACADTLNDSALLTSTCRRHDSEMFVGSLPLVVAGCKRLLVLVGEHYATRLWTQIELIAFLWSKGGSESTIDVLPLLQHRDEAKETTLLGSFDRVDVAAARCSLNEDRELMLAAIESTFGTGQALNARLRSVFASRRGEHLEEVPKPLPPGKVDALTHDSDVLRQCILPFLPIRDMLNVALVCREWHRACGEASLWTLPIVEIVFSTVEVDDIKHAEVRLFQHMGAAAEHRKWVSEGKARCYFDLVAPGLRELGRNDVDEREIAYINLLLKVMPRYMHLVYALVRSPAAGPRSDRGSILQWAPIVRPPSASPRRHHRRTALEDIDENLAYLNVNCRQLYCRCVKICSERMASSAAEVPPTGLAAAHQAPGIGRALQSAWSFAKQFRYVVGVSVFCGVVYIAVGGPSGAFGGRVHTTQSSTSDDTSRSLGIRQSVLDFVAYPLNIPPPCKWSLLLPFSLLLYMAASG